MSDSNVCDKCGARRRDESRDFQHFVTKSVIGFVTMTNYYNVFVNETSLFERSWYDCNYPGGGIRLACCGTAHGIGNFVSAVGSGSASGYIVALLKEINSGSRLDKKPRSACITRDSSNLCVVGDLRDEQDDQHRRDRNINLL
ncbi:hypothetical protein N7453_000178 [Penicillium expansum]|nr:hypothetical protein N7453_000178 [Penicillium expansum]